MRSTYRTTPHKQECTHIIYRSCPWVMSDLYLLISCIERRLTSEGKKEVWRVCLSRQVGLSGSKVKRGWWVEQWWYGESCSANTACCHKHTRYMNSLWEKQRKDKCVRGSQGGRQRAHERERVKAEGPRFTHSFVICSSCFHTGGILRLLVSISLSGIYLQLSRCSWVVYSWYMRPDKLRHILEGTKIE